MKKIIFLSLFVLLSFMACNFGNNDVTDAQSYQTVKKEKENKLTPDNNKNLVLVELFTSEG